MNFGFERVKVDFHCLTGETQFGGAFQCRQTAERGRGGGGGGGGGRPRGCRLSPREAFISGRRRDAVAEWKLDRLKFVIFEFQRFSVLIAEDFIVGFPPVKAGPNGVVDVVIASGAAGAAGATGVAGAISAAGGTGAAGAIFVRDYVLQMAQ